MEYSFKVFRSCWFHPTLNSLTTTQQQSFSLCVSAYNYNLINAGVPFHSLSSQVLCSYHTILFALIMNSFCSCYSRMYLIVTLGFFYETDSRFASLPLEQQGKDVVPCSMMLSSRLAHLSVHSYHSHLPKTASKALILQAPTFIAGTPNYPSITCGLRFGSQRNLPPSIKRTFHTRSAIMDQKVAKPAEAASGSSDHLVKLGDDVFLLESSEPVKHDPEHPDVSGFAYSSNSIRTDIQLPGHRCFRLDGR